jgi:glycosyltransferase 2 family protein
VWSRANDVDHAGGVRGQGPHRGQGYGYLLGLTSSASRTSGQTSGSAGRSPETIGTPGSFTTESARRRVPLLGLAISGIALVAVALWASRQTAPTFPTSSRSLLELAAALAVYAIATGLRGARWSAILRRARIVCAPVEPYALTVVGYMGNTVLPLRGGEVLRVILLTNRSSADWREAAGSIVPERLLDLAALAILLIAVTIAQIGGEPAGIAPSLVAAVLLVSVSTVGLGYLALRRRGHLQSFAERVRPFTYASRALVEPIGAALLVLSIGIWLVEALVFWLVADSLSLHITLLEALMVDVLASFSALIPAGPAYIGTYDAAILLGLRALRVPSSAAIAFTLLVRFVIFVPITLFGLILVVVRYGGLAQLARRPALEDGALLSNETTLRHLSSVEDQGAGSTGNVADVPSTYPQPVSGPSSRTRRR